MVQYSTVSGRADGALNRVVMNGDGGYLGYSSVRLSYLEDGWIALIGDNEEEYDGWKLIAHFPLEPGSYTLTGMRGQQVNTVALQLYVEDDTEKHYYLYQHDEDVRFIVERKSTATLHARVYPKILGVNIKVRPAVYRDE